MPIIVDHEERRLQLARAAMQEISENGLEHLKLADVAHRAGWTNGVLTHYFKNKDELLRETLRITLDEVMREALVDIDDREHSLFEAVRRWLPCFPGRMTGWKAWVAFVGNGQFSPSDRATHEEYYNRVTDRLAKRLEGDDLGLDAQEAADLLLAFMDGLSTRVVMEPDQWPRDRQESLLATFIQMLR